MFLDNAPESRGDERRRSLWVEGATYDIDEDGDEDGARDLASDLGVRVLGAAEELVVAAAEQGADDGEDEDRKGRDDHAVAEMPLVSRMSWERRPGSTDGATYQDHACMEPTTGFMMG